MLCIAILNFLQVLNFIWPLVKDVDTFDHLRYSRTTMVEKDNELIPPLHKVRCIVIS